MRKKGLYYLVVFVLIIGLASAVDFEVDEDSSFIETDYLEGDFVMGQVNMSFDEQKNVDFESSFGGSITLLEVLEKMGYVAGTDFTCDPTSCEGDYQPRAGSESKHINLAQKATYGFKIEDDHFVEEIRDLRFTVSVNEDRQGCNNTLFIDLLDDGKIEFYNEEYISYDCPYYLNDMNYGCFDLDDVTDQIGIGNEPFCELLEDLPPAAAYRAGAIVKKERVAGPLSFVMLSANGDCDEPISNVAESGPILIGDDQDVNVILEVDRVPLEKIDVMVCVWSTAGDEGAYQIRINEDDNDLCGVNDPCQHPRDRDEMDIDFEIYAIPKAYALVGDKQFEVESDLLEEVNDYLNETYHHDCSGDNGCVIPFSLWGIGYPDQRIHSAYLRYDAQGFPSTRDIFELRERPAEINSEDYLVLNVDEMEFRVPDSDGRHTFELELDGEEVIRQPIDVEIGFSFNLAPRFAFVGRNTAFTAVTSMNVSSSVWDFGDGSALVHSSDNTAQHAYSSEGNFVVRVTLTKPTGSSYTNSSKRFRVVVGEARASANLTLIDYESRVANLEADINSFSQWMREPIKNTFGLDAIKANIVNKRTEFNTLSQSSAATDDDYIQIINYLLNTGVPYSVFVSESGTLPALVGFNNVDPAHIKEISGSSTSVSDDDLRAHILDWMDGNYEVMVEFQTVAAQGDLDTFGFMRKYNVDIDQKTGAGSDYAYLIINYPSSSDAMIMESPAGAEETSLGGTYIGMDASSPLSSLEFLISGTSLPSTADLGIYISPVISAFNINEKPIREGCWWCDQEGEFDWNKFIIGMVILFTAALSIYIILQAWYKRYYEKHLFKNPNDLYNLVSFIYNSRKAGLKDRDARAKLKRRGWKGEQITYAFNKLDGRRTGMWEIPLFKFIENRKVKKELEKKQGGGPVDTRFIKRPNL
ncbi:MAG: PKD domain-containing protein [Nanoarchaeota archaeon]